MNELIHCPEEIIKLSCTYQWGIKSGKKDEKIDTPKPENINHPSPNPGETSANTLAKQQLLQNDTYLHP